MMISQAYQDSIRLIERYFSESIIILKRKRFSMNVKNRTYIRYDDFQYYYKKILKDLQLSAEYYAESPSVDTSDFTNLDYIRDMIVDILHSLIEKHILSSDNCEKHTIELPLRHFTAIIFHPEFIEIARLGTHLQYNCTTGSFTFNGFTFMCSYNETKNKLKEIAKKEEEEKKCLTTPG